MNRKVKAIFLLMTLFYWISVNSYTPVLVNYLGMLGATSVFAGIAAGAYGITQMIIRIPLGIFSDIYTRFKHIIAAGNAFSFVACMVMFLIPSPVAVLFGRLIAGIGAATWICFFVLFATYFDKSKVSNSIGYINFVCYGGQVVGVLTGSRIAHIFGIKYTFLFGALSGIAGFILSLFIKDMPYSNSGKNTYKEYISACKEKMLIISACLCIIERAVTFGVVFGFMPKYAAQMGLSESVIGFLTTLFLICISVASFIGGSYFAKKFEKRNVLILAFLVAAAGTAWLPFTANVWQLAATQLLCGLGCGVLLTVLTYISMENAQLDKKGTAMGTFQAIYSLGILGGPFLIGLISDIANYVYGYLTIAFLAILGGVLTFFLIPVSTRQKEAKILQTTS
jgi:MFS family permease